MLCIPNKSNCAASTGFELVFDAEVTTISVPKMRRARLLNSNSVKIAFIFSSSCGHIINSSSLNSTSKSVTIVANNFDSKPCCAKLITFSCCLPFNSCACSIKFSIEPYFCINIFEVFSPIPGIPGMLSAASPQSPKMSITCSGRSTSNFSHTSFTPKISGGFPPRPGLKIKDVSVTN